MTRRRKWLLAFGITFTVLAAACAGSIHWLDRDADREEASCTTSWQAFEKSVQDGRKWTDKDIPGIGDYLETHWLGKALGDPCSRAPGPTDWVYQGFIRLRPQDATALRSAKQWRPLVPTEIWPALLPYAPADPRWQYADHVYLDPETDILFFSFSR
jgi:hypothetical protein